MRCLLSVYYTIKIYEMGILIWVTLYIYALQGSYKGIFLQDAGRKSLSGIGINRDMRMKYLFLVFREEEVTQDLALIIKRYNFVKFSIKAHRCC